jgi:hypothetical protein
LGKVANVLLIRTLHEQPRIRATINTMGNGTPTAHSSTVQLTRPPRVGDRVGGRVDDRSRGDEDVRMMNPVPSWG